MLLTSSKRFKNTFTIYVTKIDVSFKTQITNSWPRNKFNPFSVKYRRSGDHALNLQRSFFSWRKEEHTVLSNDSVTLPNRFHTDELLAIGITYSGVGLLSVLPVWRWFKNTLVPFSGRWKKSFRNPRRWLILPDGEVKIWKRMAFLSS